MRKSLFLFAIVSLAMAQLAIADDTAMKTLTPASMNPDETTIKPCENIADSCQAAGYTRNGDKGKRFWRDCMKPILLGKTITDVTVDEGDVKACRQFKIEKVRKMLEQLKSAQ